MTAPIRSYRTLFWTFAILGLVLDQVSKYGIFAWLPEKGEWPIIQDIFSIVHPEVLNYGALFGIGADQGWKSNLFFACVSALAVVVIIIWAMKPAPAHDRLLSAALGLILSGAMGNFYDRVVCRGVRDFVWVRFAPVFDWPVFNLADSFLVCGAALLMYHAFFSHPPADQASAKQDRAGATVSR